LQAITEKQTKTTHSIALPKAAYERECIHLNHMGQSLSNANLLCLKFIESVLFIEVLEEGYPAKTKG